MSIYIKIKRQAAPGEKAYFQTFAHEGGNEKTIANILQDLNNRDVLVDIDGNKARKIAWDCSCQEKKCGACAMLIERRPALACSTFIKDLKIKNNTIILEPLSKFPIIKDLRVDRSIMFKNIKKLKLWLENQAKFDKDISQNLYESSKCLMCGCCLEVCPNYSLDGEFGGAEIMNAAFRIINQSDLDEHKEEIIKKYKKSFFAGCGKSLACEDICPAGIPLEHLIVKTNAAAVWKRDKHVRRHNVEDVEVFNQKTI